MESERLKTITTEKVLEMLDELIVQQRGKCMKIARRINPRLTPDDLMNPFDWPEVNENPQFVWEDGLLAGLQAAHAAVAARFEFGDPAYEVQRLKTEPSAEGLATDPSKENP